MTCPKHPHSDVIKTMGEAAEVCLECMAEDDPLCALCHGTGYIACADRRGYHMAPCVCTMKKLDIPADHDETNKDRT